MLMLVRYCYCAYFDASVCTITPHISSSFSCAVVVAAAGELVDDHRRLVLVEFCYGFFCTTKSFFCLFFAQLNLVLYLIFMKMDCNLFAVSSYCNFAKRR